MPPHYLSDSRLWFPGLAEYLVADFTSKAQERRALVDHYGTHRWLTGDTSASTVDMGVVRLGRRRSTIEHLPISITSCFSGLTFAESNSSRATAQIQAAAEVLDGVDSLANTVGWLVRSIHLLQAPQDNDVSHSSPQLPFSVFVSIPEPAERDANLRLAESLIHESMHLQLSLLETVESLISAPDTCGYSPWKRELRSIEGLLHGIYVFAVIYQILGVFPESQPTALPYCIKRRSEIKADVETLPEQPGGLSVTGSALWQRCRQHVLADDQAMR